jgi:hypothetical protein
MPQRLARPARGHLEFHQDPLADGRERSAVLWTSNFDARQHAVSFFCAHPLATQKLSLEGTITHFESLFWGTLCDGFPQCVTKVIIPSFSSLSRFVLARYRFTQIAVDAQIKTPGGKTYDVIFVGTGESRVRIRRFFFCVPRPRSSL